MKLKTYQVWSEGYCCTGESAGAKFHGEFEGETFRDAVIKWKETLKDEYSRSCVNVDRLTLWGCRLFDNEIDARKNFG